MGSRSIPPKTTGGRSRARWGLPGVLLILLVLAVYSPALSNGFIWDDDANVTDNETLRSASGLSSIWLDPFANQQYYPLTHTSFWIEYQLFGSRPAGYHLINLLLHAASAVLLWRILRELSVPGAWLAAAIFAVHPLQVESVAWITERKNTLSGLLLMLSVLLLVRHSGLSGERARSGVSWAATGVFLLALSAKTAVATAPTALIAIFWWKRDRFDGRDVTRVAPMLAAGVAAGLVTAWLEKHHAGAAGDEWSFGLAEKIVLAGRSLWFYATKFVWPSGQTFIYPRWEIDAGDWTGWLLAAAAAAVPPALWFARHRIGKGPATAALAYGILIAPASGFFGLYFFRYSFVQDHFQYFACIPLAALAAAGLATVARHRVTLAVLTAAVILTLGGMSWQRSHLFKDSETLWRDTLSRNPDAWMAHINLARILVRQGRGDDALAHYAAGLASDPFHSDPAVRRGSDLVGKGEIEQGLEELRRAIAVRPYGSEALSGIGVIVASKGRLALALDFFNGSVAADPGYASGHLNRGLALHRLDRYDEAESAFREVLRLSPDYRDAHQGLATTLHALGRNAEASVHLQEYRNLGGTPDPDLVRRLSGATE